MRLDIHQGLSRVRRRRDSEALPRSSAASAAQKTNTGQVFTTHNLVDLQIIDQAPYVKRGAGIAILSEALYTALDDDYPNGISNSKQV